MWDFLDLICAIHVETKNRSLLLKFPLLKKWHFLDLVCSTHVVTITIGFSYSNRSLLKKWHFLDLICAIYVVTMRTEIYFVKSPFLKNWHFLDLVCAYKFEFCTKIRMHPAQPRFARPGGVHNKEKDRKYCFQNKKRRRKMWAKSQSKAGPEKLQDGLYSSVKMPFQFWL